MPALNYGIRRQSQFPPVYSDALQQNDAPDNTMAPPVYGGANAIPAAYSEAGGADDPGYSGYPYTYPGAPNRTPTGTFQPNTQTSDINQMWRDNRTFALDQGNALDQQIADQYNRAGTLEDRYRTGTGMASPGMEQAYGSLWQTPGYTADETGNIVRDQQFNSLITPQWKYDAMNPTDEEASGIRGNTGSYTDYFDPDQLRGIDTNTANMQRGQVAEAKGNVAGALDQQRADYAKAMDQSAQNAALEGGASAVRGALDPNRLRYDPNVAAKATMTDQDVQDVIGQAGRTVGNRYGALKDSIKQGAIAQGNADALAIAAAGERANQDQTVAGADAMTDARIAARNAQRQNLMDLEGQRIAAEQGYSGLATSNEQQLAARGLSAAENAAARGMTAAGTTGANALQGAQYTGNLATGVEQGIGGQEANTGKYIASTGTGIRQAQDTANAARNLQLYGARQQNAQFAIPQQFGQGMAVNTQLSNANTNVANARRQGQQEYRGWTGDQTAQQQQAGQTATGQRIAGYGARTGAQNQATQGLSNWELGNKQSSPFNKAMQVAGLLVGASRNRP